MIVATDNFLDFTTFFYVLKESTSLNNVELFTELVQYLYEHAGIGKDITKDDSSEILRKKKAFPKKVRNFATLNQVEKVCNDYNTYLNQWFNNPETLGSKLKYLVKIEDCFFEEADREALSKYDDIGHIMAYILIKTVATSDKSRILKHSEDYNPFRNYQEATYDKISELTKVKEDLEVTGRYLEKKYSAIAIDKMLLSNGETLCLQRDEDPFNNSFSIVSDSSGNTKPLQEFMSLNDNLIIIGEGGIGKTTALFSYIKRCRKENSATIPLYVRLSDCSTYTDHEHMILNYLMNSIGYAVNGRVSESFKDILDEFSDETVNEKPRYTLLLDGFNEITTMDMGEVRYSIAKEINTLLKNCNVRVILTTRESDLYGLRISDFISVNATGIKKSDVGEYLRKNLSADRLQETLANNELMQYLQIPLFLKMFTYLENKSGYLPKTKGEILYHFYNGISNFYTEKKNISEKNDRRTSLIVYILLDFLLPHMGFFMVENERFQIEEDDFYVLMEDTRNYISSMIKCNPILKTQYNVHTLGHRKTVALYNEFDIDDLLLLLTDGLRILYKDADGRIYFCHQYVRDYFSALFCVNGIVEVANKSKIDYESLSEIRWGCLKWSKEQVQMICEIMNANMVYEPEKNLGRAINAFRGFTLVDMDYHFALSNIISTLSFLKKGDLSNYDFSSLDLSECRLSCNNFSNPYTGRKSSFSGAVISEATFSPEGHRHPIKAWTLSDDEHYIASLSDHNELKIWNIARQECIYTSLKPDIPDTREINTFHYIESLNTLLVMENGSNEADYSSAWVFNIITNKINTFHTEIPAGERILYFNYDYFSKKFVIISDNSRIYQFVLDGEIRSENFYVNPSFISRIQQQRRNREISKIFGQPNHEIYLLADNQILYIELNRYDLYKLLILKKDILKDTYFRLFLYDRLSKDFKALKCSPAGEESIAIISYGGRDFIHEYITISEDRKKIVVRNDDEMFIYDITDGDYMFKRLAKIPDEDLGLKYCSSSDVLTLHHARYDVADFMQYSVDKQEILWKKTTNNIDFRSQIVCTHNYIVSKIRKGNCIFKVTNLYSWKENSLCLNANQSIVMSFFSKKDEFCVLYSNGTLICLDKENMVIRSAYNICPGMYVLSCTYSKDQDLLCAVINTYHSYLLFNDTKILFFNLENGENGLLPETFDKKVLIRFVLNERYVAAFVQKEIFLISTETPSVIEHIDFSDVSENIKYLDSPVDIIVKDDVIYVVYEWRLIVMIVENKKIRILDVISIPSIDYLDVDTAFLVNQKMGAAIFRIKAIEKSNMMMIYKREAQESIQRTPYDWNIVNLYRGGIEFLTRYDEEFFPLRKTDYHVLCMGDRGRNCIVMQEDRLYIYNTEDNSKERINLPMSIPIYFDEKARIVYLVFSESKKIDRDFDRICRYDIDKKERVSQSPANNPNELCNGCDFGEQHF